MWNYAAEGAMKRTIITSPICFIYLLIIRFLVPHYTPTNLIRQGLQLLGRFDTQYLKAVFERAGILLYQP